MSRYLISECLFFAIFGVCDLETYTNMFDGWIVEISFVGCVSHLSLSFLFPFLIIFFFPSLFFLKTFSLPFSSKGGCILNIIVFRGIKFNLKFNIYIYIIIIVNILGV